MLSTPPPPTLPANCKDELDVSPIKSGAICCPRQARTIQWRSALKTPTSGLAAKLRGTHKKGELRSKRIGQKRKPQGHSSPRGHFSCK